MTPEEDMMRSSDPRAQATDLASLVQITTERSWMGEPLCRATTTALCGLVWSDTCTDRAGCEGPMTTLGLIWRYEHHQACPRCARWRELLAAEKLVAQGYRFVPFDRGPGLIQIYTPSGKTYLAERTDAGWLCHCPARRADCKHQRALAALMEE